MKRCLKCDTLFEGEPWTCVACGYIPEKINGYLSFAPDLTGISAFDVHSFKDLGETLDNSFWFPPRNRLITWAFKKYFSNVKEYLEIGCGTGYVLKGISDCNPGMNITGTDIFSEALPTAEERLAGKANFIQTNALHLPFRDEFDVIGAFDVIEHIEEDVMAMHELYKALKPGGSVLITVPRHMFLWSDVDTTAHHKRRYGSAEFRRKVEEAGFSITRLFSFGMLTLPIQYLSRKLLLKKSEKHSDVLELNMSPITSFILEKLMDIDQIPIKLGINYPFAGSLVVVAKKV
jgi:SAM-dependent methyltransferase